MHGLSQLADAPVHLAQQQLCIMTKPVTSSVCNHSFDEDSVLGLMRQKGNGFKCPVVGCAKPFKKSDLEPSTELARKIKKYLKEENARAKRQQSQDMSDEEEEMLVV